MPYHLVTDGPGLASALAYLSQQPAVGLSVENGAATRSRKTRKKKTLGINPASAPVRLLQLAGLDGSVFLFDLFHLGGLPDALKTFLSRNAVTIGFNLMEEAAPFLYTQGVILTHPVDLLSAWVLSDGYAGLPLHDRTLPTAALHVLGQNNLPQTTFARLGRGQPQCCSS